jgi:formylglycine-generating enzyme required for sulfatase activity
MAKAFDPYHVWLGIAPAEQPANHYRLLGINLFESDPEVIDNAADRQMVHLRSFQLGKQAELSQRLLNEMAAAKVCLLRPEKKAAYDQQLRQQLQTQAEAAESQRPEIDSQLALALEQEAEKGRSHARQAAPPGRGALLGTAGAVVALVVIVAVWATVTRKTPVEPARGKGSEIRDWGLVQKEVASQPPTTNPKSEIPNLKSQIPNPQPPVPPLAKPAMSAAEAAQIQKQWAEYLGLPVKETNSIGMPLMLIPPGEFDMGSTPEEIAWAMEAGKEHKEVRWYFDEVASESPRHRVKITKPFRVGMCTVTQGEYEKVMGVNPSAGATRPFDTTAFKPPLSEIEAKYRRAYDRRMVGNDTSRRPVETVTWDQAMEFCRRLSAMPAERGARRLYRLPTEAEWEYACRAGTTTHWNSGDDEASFFDVAWFARNAGEMTHPVGQKRPNAWGLHDMHGNAWQWCADWFSADYYKQSPPSDPAGSLAGFDRALRGGTCVSVSYQCCSAFRNHFWHALRYPQIGFRVVVDFSVVSGTPLSPSESTAGGEGTSWPTRMAPRADKGTDATAASGTAIAATRGGSTGETPVSPGRPPVVGLATARPTLPHSSNPQSQIPNPSALLPVPADDAREAAGKLAQDVYRSDYADAKSPAGKQALAQRILDDASKVRDDAAKRYALLSLARDVAIAGQDEKLALEAIDELGRTFAIDAWAMKADTLERVAKVSRPAAARCDLAERALVLAEEALKADQLAAADALAKLALGEAGKARERGLAGRARAQSKEIQEVLKASSAAESARAQLKANPADADAHLAMGRYLCLVKGDWEAGLPHLVQGSDADLKALAEDDLQHVVPPWHPEAGKPPPGPAPAAAAMKLADAWWELAEKAKGRERECLFLRAGYWYEEVAAGPEAGENSTKIDLRRKVLFKQAVRVPPARVLTNSIGMPLVLIPSGEFMMGSTPAEVALALAEGKKSNEDKFFVERVPTEAPRHPVKISKPFYLGIYSVTQGEYEAIMGLNPSAFAAKQIDASALKPPLDPRNTEGREKFANRVAGADTSRHPVETVSWENAVEFCRKLSNMPVEREARRIYRLPTEAEWEYACRAEAKTRWLCGDDEAGLAEYAWFHKNSGGMTHPVGGKLPNAWGLYDMHGNVEQWCSDWFGRDYYSKSPLVDPTGPRTGSFRVLRGSAWGGRPASCRSSYRIGNEPAARRPFNGFRVAVER